VTINRLAELMDVAPAALDPECGEQRPRLVAFVDEAWCIGCTLCIAACPVDAIVGAAKRMHAIIETLCTGCELCIAPCPVECIHLEAARSGPIEPVLWLREQAQQAKQRYSARNQRLGGASALARHAAKSMAKAGSDSLPGPSRDNSQQSAHAAVRRKRLIREAVARSKARRMDRQHEQG
jgi:electron transport complex protein RnfB